MSSSSRIQPSSRQRLEELIAEAISLYSDRLTNPDSAEYQEVFGICLERAEDAFCWHRNRCESDATVFEQLAPRQIPETHYTSTHPLQDLVQCELVMRGHSPAVSMFTNCFRGLAEKNMRKIDPTHRPAPAPGSRGRSDSKRDFSLPDTAAELAIQALLHDYREEYRKGTQNRPAGKHAGELDGLPLRGLPLRSFKARTPLFNWMCTILPRLLRKLQVLRSVTRTEELGTGTIAAGTHRIRLHTGYFHETRHIRALVRISGAGRDGKPLGTRLLDVHSNSSALTQQPALTTVSVPRSVRLVHRDRRERQLAESFDNEDASDDLAAAIPENCTAVLEKLMHAALTQAKLTARQLELLRGLYRKTQADLAKELGIDPGNITRQRDSILKKLQHQFQALRESADEETQACLELVYRNSRCPTFAELLHQILQDWPMPLSSSPPQPSLHGTWKRVVRNVPEEAQPSQSGAGVEWFMNEILRNSDDEQRPFQAED